jgi:hypothetical protein
MVPHIRWEEKNTRGGGVKRERTYQTMKHETQLDQNDLLSEVRVSPVTVIYVTSREILL